jgi:ankyrin repeat protein
MELINLKSIYVGIIFTISSFMVFWVQALLYRRNNVAVKKLNFFSGYGLSMFFFDGILISLGSIPLTSSLEFYDEYEHVPEGKGELIINSLPARKLLKITNYSFVPSLIMIIFFTVGINYQNSFVQNFEISLKLAGNLLSYIFFFTDKLEFIIIWQNNFNNCNDFFLIGSMFLLIYFIYNLIFMNLLVVSNKKYMQKLYIGLIVLSSFDFIINIVALFRFNGFMGIIISILLCLSSFCTGILIFFLLKAISKNIGLYRPYVPVAEIITEDEDDSFVEDALIDACESVDVSDEERLIFASEENDITIAEEALYNGANINVQFGEFEETPLITASRQDSFEMVKFLISQGADINRKNNEKDTALSIAAANGFYDIADLLLKNNVVLNSKNELGETSLHKAVLNDSYTLVELLIENDVQLNARDNEGKTAIITAFDEEHYDIACLLKESGAKITEKEYKIRMNENEENNFSFAPEGQIYFENSNTTTIVDTESINDLVNMVEGLILEHIKKVISQFGHNNIKLYNDRFAVLINNSREISGYITDKLLKGTSDMDSHSMMVEYDHIILNLTTFPTSQDTPEGIREYSSYYNGYTETFDRIWGMALEHNSTNNLEKDFCHILFFFGPESPVAKIHMTYISYDKGKIGIFPVDLLTFNEKDTLGL